MSPNRYGTTHTIGEILFPPGAWGVSALCKVRGGLTFAICGTGPAPQVDPASVLQPGKHGTPGILKTRWQKPAAFVTNGACQEPPHVRAKRIADLLSRDRSPVPIVEMPSNAPPLENLVLPATLPEHVRHLLLMWAIGTPRTGNLLAAALRPLL